MKNICMGPVKFALRSFSTTRSIYNSQSVAHTQISKEIESRGPWLLSQDLSETHIRQVNASLISHIPLPVTQTPGKLGNTSRGASIAPGSHLYFFNDISPEKELSSDGYHKNQAPDESIFPARMWLGGSIEFNNKKFATPLIIGSEGSATEEISKVNYISKNTPSGLAERIDVSLVRKLYGSNLQNKFDNSKFSTIKEFLNDGNISKDLDKEWAIKENRSLAYFTPISGSNRKDIFSRVIKRKYILRKKKKKENACTNNLV